MYEIIFLLVLAGIWIIFAVVQDLKKREIADWLNFSLIIFALGFRFFYSLFAENGFNFFYQGLIGFGIFLVLGNVFYYSRLFAGGDAKLMMALGAILPFSPSFFENLNIFINFIFIFLFVGAVYGLVWSLFLCFRNWKLFKKSFASKFEKNKKLIYLAMFGGLIVMVLGFLNWILFFVGVLIFIFPYFHFYAKAVDDSCMVKKINSKDLTPGDWLYRDIKIGKEIIKATWDGVNKKQISKLKKHKKFVLIRQGIPFSPVFLISFLIIIWIYLGNSFWKFNFF